MGTTSREKHIETHIHLWGIHGASVYGRHTFDSMYLFGFALLIVWMAEGIRLLLKRALLHLIVQYLLPEGRSEKKRLSG